MEKVVLTLSHLALSINEKTLVATGEFCSGKKAFPEIELRVKGGCCYVLLTKRTVGTFWMKGRLKL